MRPRLARQASILRIFALQEQVAEAVVKRLRPDLIEEAAAPGAR
jgi:hypothetical protein